MVYIHEPATKWIHTIDKILVPENTKVIAFGNNACNYYDMLNHYYGKQTNNRKTKTEIS